MKAWAGDYLRQLRGAQPARLGWSGSISINCTALTPCAAAEQLGALAEMRNEAKIRPHRPVGGDRGAGRAGPQSAHHRQRENAYNVQRRNHDRVVDYCAAEGIAFIPYTPSGGELAEVDGPLCAAEEAGGTAAQSRSRGCCKRSPAVLPIRYGFAGAPGQRMSRPRFAVASD